MAKQYNFSLVAALLTFLALIIVDKIITFRNYSETKSPQQLTKLKGQFSLIPHGPKPAPPTSESVKGAVTQENVLRASISTQQIAQKPPALGQQTVVLASFKKTRENQFNRDQLNLQSPVKKSWDDFASLSLAQISPYQTTNSKQFIAQLLSTDFEPVYICPPAVESRALKPMLSSENLTWCKYALDPKGGQVVVGKSWGKFAKDHPKQEIFEELNCNAYSKGINPSCDDEWGDSHIRNWKNNEVKTVRCKPNRLSRVKCYDNENLDRFCVMHNVQINFDMMHDKPRRPGETMSRIFDPGFLSVDCGIDKSFLKWSHLFSTEVQKQRNCDYVINGTTIVFSHDDIRNAGHTMNDMMNVWMMMWLTNTASNIKSMILLSIDSFNLGHNFKDDTSFSPFYLTYKKNFKQMIGGMEFKDKTVCLQKAIFQPQPAKWYVWDSWFKDATCSYVPSTLFQRWNFAVRQSYNLLSKQALYYTNNEVRILIISRVATENRWGHERTSRNILNMNEVIEALKQFVHQTDAKVIEIYPIAFEKLSYEDQIREVSKASILVGTHGAGLALALHMSIGSKFCCGVVEIFPQGEFFRIRGHGNMLRRLGVKYYRVDVSIQNSKDNGVIVPVKETIAIVNSMLTEIIQTPSCVRSAALNDPYFET